MVLTSHGASTGGGRSRRASLLVACAGLLLLGSSLAACDGQPHTFQQQRFCTNVNVAPHHQSDRDRCYASNRGGSYLYLYQVYGGGNEHSGCIDAVDASWNLVTNWSCSYAGSWSQLDFDGTRWLQGVVRNNHPNKWTHVWGAQNGIGYP